MAGKPAGNGGPTGAGSFLADHIVGGPASLLWLGGQGLAGDVHHASARNLTMI
ncbi:MAG TPA: hypothetical protein VMU34_04695 [Mycobacterium sp.]|nr:hypothetical protein [Mycobacterium sp.]